MQKMEYIKKCSRDIAQSGLARLSGGQKVAGSNPATPTKIKKTPKGVFFILLWCIGLKPYIVKQCLGSGRSEAE